MRQRHGDVERLAEVDFTPVEIVHVQVECEGIKKPYDLCVRQTMGQAKAAMCKLIGVPADSVSLFYKDTELALVQGDMFALTQIVTMQRRVHSYRVADGDCFILQPRFSE